ncbi:MAG: class II fructose-bisphosphatase [Deltaproteobacteria bacterium]|nr:MAG: class II fructose-bisphosphatase [Deltaproteobacteria bacterium]
MLRFLSLEMVRVTEAAAIAAARLMGRGDKEAADAAAVEAMRAEFRHVDIDGRVVIGEGEIDEAPMLYIGERVGSGAPNLPQVDIAVDPLEGTTITAAGGPNALACLAIGGRDSMLHAPDTYMSKIAAGPECKGALDLRLSATENLGRVAECKRMPISELTVCILDRPRHDDLVAEVRRTGARIRLIRDGDVSAALASAISASPVDVLIGIGGAPEGVLAAAALRGLDGEMQGQLRFRSQADRERAIRMGLEDPDRIFGLTDLAGGDDVIFAATGVTDGDFLKGVRFTGDGARSHSVVMRSHTGTVRYITAFHDFGRKRDFPLHLEDD